MTSRQFSRPSVQRPRAALEAVLSGKNTDDPTTAKTVCIEFLTLLQTLAPNDGILDWKHHIASNLSRFGYLDGLIRLKLNLMRGRWPRACHELQNVVHFYPVTQAALRQSLISLLEQYCTEG